MKAIKRIGVTALGVCLVLTIAAGQEKFISEYRIGPKDLLEVSVFGLNELNRTVRVSETGMITLPPLGEVVVEGLTKSELEKRLSSLLEEKYLQNPQVSVFIREYQSKKVSIIGAVRTPGSYELLGRQTVLQMISQAGGITNEAGEEIVILRELPDGTGTSLRLPIEDLMLKGDIALNVPLEPNDVISIPIDKTVKVYVFGQVRNPGALDVRRSRIPTLLQAIAQAGGFGERASKSRVVIKRKDDKGKEVKQEINVKDVIKGKIKDVQLQENDVVFVPETVF